MMKLKAKQRLLNFQELSGAAKNVMFHVTRTANLPSIQKKGLVPSPKPQGHSVGKGDYVKNAIYFSSSLKAAKAWLQMLSSDDKELDVSAAAEFAILKVDVTKWVSKMKEDPAFGDQFDLDDAQVDAYYLQGVPIPAKNILSVIQVKNIVRKMKESDSFYFPEMVRLDGLSLAQLRKKLAALSPTLLKNVRTKLAKDTKVDKTTQQLDLKYAEDRQWQKDKALREKGQQRLDRELKQLGY
jgi:hypothetical protein